MDLALLIVQQLPHFKPLLFKSNLQAKSVEYIGRLLGLFVLVWGFFCLVFLLLLLGFIVGFFL